MSVEHTVTTVSIVTERIDAVVRPRPRPNRYAGRSGRPAMADTDADPPNVLFVFPDQHRPDWVGWSDVPVRTPTLSGLAERGVAFENAVCPSPVCGPSRACLASGMEYDRAPVRDHDTDYPLAARTLYGRLRDEAGYHVLGTGKFDLQKLSGDHGLDGRNNLAANGFSDGVNNAGKWDAFGRGQDGPGDPYTRYLHEEGLLETHLEDFRRRREETRSHGASGDVAATFPTALPEHAYCDNYVGRNSLELLREAPEEEPWFLQVNFTGPHNPWDVTGEMHGWYRDPDVEFPSPVEPDGQFDEEKHQKIRRNYAAMVENVDRWLGRFLEAIEERGEREETLVVFASDHGEMLGDHGRWYKRSPYRASAGVPLVCAGPMVEDRGVVDVPATILDLHATVLDYAGVDPGPVDSRSMRPYLAGGVPARDVVYSGVGHWRMAFDGRYKLVRGWEGPDDESDAYSDRHARDEAATKYALRERPAYLFDLDTDPDETGSVADERPDARERMAAALSELRPL